MAGAGLGPGGRERAQGSEKDRLYRLDQNDWDPGDPAFARRAVAVVFCPGEQGRLLESRWAALLHMATGPSRA